MTENRSGTAERDPAPSKPSGWGGCLLYEVEEPPGAAGDPCGRAAGLLLNG